MTEDWAGFLLFQVCWLGPGERKSNLTEALPVCVPRSHEVGAPGEEDGNNAALSHI